MKKLLLFIFLSFSLNCFCQQESYVGISTGFSLPQGKYANNTYTDFFLNSKVFLTTLSIPPGNPGFAKTGYHICGEGAEYFSDFLGLAGMISYSQHSFDSRPFTNDISNTSIRYSGTVTGSFSARPYQNIAFMLGPVASIKASDKVTFDFRILIGMLSTSYPTEDINQFYNDPYTIDPIATYLHVEAPASTSFAFSPGALMRYHLNSKFGLFVKTEALFAEQSYNLVLNIRENFNDPSKNGATNLTFVMQQSVSIFNFGLGFAYQFE